MKKEEKLENETKSNDETPNKRKLEKMDVM